MEKYNHPTIVTLKLFYAELSLHVYLRYCVRIAFEKLSKYKKQTQFQYCKSSKKYSLDTKKDSHFTNDHHNKAKQFELRQVIFVVNLYFNRMENDNCFV